MKKPYIKKAWKACSVVRAMNKRNRSEDKEVLLSDIRKIKRAQVIASHPDIDERELERRLDRIMSAGASPNKDAMPWIEAPPAHVLNGDQALSDAIKQRRRRLRR